MAAPFIVLGGKGLDYVVDKHFDKIPDRILHVHDPKKKEENRKQKEKRKRKEAGDRADAGHETSESDSNDSDREREHSHRRTRSESPMDTRATFDDDKLDRRDRMQYPDARNPTFTPNPAVDDPYRFVDPRRPFPQAYYPMDGAYAAAGNENDYTPRKFEPLSESDSDYDSEQDRRKPARKSKSKRSSREEKSSSNRPALRSRSSHQGDRYYPSASATGRDGGSTAMMYDDRDRRDGKDRHDTKRNYEDKVVDRFSGTDLGLGALALGSVAGGYAGYRAGGGRLTGRSRNGLSPLVFGLIGAIAGGTGLNAVERGYEKSKTSKDGRVTDSKRESDNRSGKSRGSERDSPRSGRSERGDRHERDDSSERSDDYDNRYDQGRTRDWDDRNRRNEYDSPPRRSKNDRDTRSQKGDRGDRGDRDLKNARGDRNERSVQTTRQESRDDRVVRSDRDTRSEAGDQRGRRDDQDRTRRNERAASRASVSSEDSWGEDVRSKRERRGSAYFT